jgi:hypothetical protein
MTEPLNAFTPFVNISGVLGTQHSRSINQGRNIQPGRQRNTYRRIYRRRVQLNAPVDNEDTLKRIANLSQQTANDPLINQFFNGFSFI